MHAVRLVLLLLLLLTARSGQAQTPIHHCIGADGHPVFTDQPCARLQATPVPASSAGSPASTPLLRPPAVTCAADLEALRQAVIDAFANADANRLAGLMLWSGYGRGTVIERIGSMATWMREPLVEIATPGDEAASELVISTMPAGGEARATRFAIERHAGCLWLRGE